MSISDGLKELSEPANKLTVPLASSIGETLKDLWDLVFGGFDTYVEKKRATRLKDLQSFKDSLERKVAAIPEDRLQEPPLSVVGPAMEASKYYYEEETLREMFANLIASSMDTDLCPKVHPSFTEIIKQISPLDAENFSAFGNKEYTLPIAQIHCKTKGEPGYKVLLSNVFIANPARQDLHSQSRSISALERVGLVSVNYQLRIVSGFDYKIFEETQLYKGLVAAYPEKDISIAYGIVQLTPLGLDFRDVCFSLDK